MLNLLDVVSEVGETIVLRVTQLSSCQDTGRPIVLESVTGKLPALGLNRVGFALTSIESPTWKLMPGVCNMKEPGLGRVLQARLQAHKLNKISESPRLYSSVLDG